jgi:hypothetical protein
MLYNPSWEKKQPFTMPHFIDWLDRHPRDETYDYTDHVCCLNAQYHKEFHRDYIPPGLMMRWDSLPSGWRRSVTSSVSDCYDPNSFVAQAEWIAYGGLGGGERTFGAASDRARCRYQTSTESVI